MPTFYQTPGIGQLDSGHIDSNSFSYVESLVTEEEWPIGVAIGVVGR